jgi:SAM-dependent methyltransferase
MTKRKRQLQANRALWDEWTSVHAKSEFYDLEGFKAGKLTLKSIEREELDDVSGKSLLHLQCHFGLDTLSWARLGAQVTGVNFSEKAVALARSLSEELGVGARLIGSDVHDLPNGLDEKFDVVFTSYGVLPWLHDLARWAQLIAHFLRDGGIFYIVEHHPCAQIFDDEHPEELRVRYPYFHSPEPLECVVEGSYADRAANVSQLVSYQWPHSLSDLLNASLQSELRIEFLHEFPFCAYQMFPFMERGEDGWWRLPDSQPEIPLLFSLKATKPG